MNEKERKDLALSKIILLALAFLAIVIVIWLAWLLPSASAASPYVSWRYSIGPVSPLR